MSDLLSVDEARALLLGLAAATEGEAVAIGNAHGRYLARGLRSRRDQPAVDLSAMDGYAVRFADLPGPWYVIGESAAGRGFDRTIGKREAVRIFTGAPVPEGADTILVQEDAARDGERLTLAGDGPGMMGKHIRKAAADFGKASELIAAGTRLTSRHIGLAIAGGHDSAQVHKKPVLALISTGDELVMPGKAVNDPALIPASNGPMLIAQFDDQPVRIIDHGIVADDLEALARVIERARKADIIVTIGGASVGDHDLVQQALRAAGARIDFWRIAMKPGKPMLAGTLGGAVLLGLPGNPASALVTAKLFLEPLIAAMNGAADPGPHPQYAILTHALRKGGAREEYLRGRWHDGGVESLDGQMSALLKSLARAELLIRRPAHAPAAQAGEITEILPLA